MTTKRKLANKMLSKKERLERVSVFDAKAWQAKKKATAARVARKQEAAHSRAVVRKAASGTKTITKKDLKKAQAVVKKIEAKRKKNAKYASKS